MACPTGVKIAEINARARAALVTQGHVPPIRRLRNNVMARTELLGKFAQPVAPLANFVFNFKPARWAFEKTFGVAKDAYFPPFTRQKFSTWLRKRAASHAAQTGEARRKVVYFHGCSTEYYEPRVGQAAVRVLEANGCEVIVPPQNCCGLPLLSNGEFKAARQYHENNVRYLIEYARQGIPIVGTSTSCTLTLKEEAPELLDMHDADTQLVARNTYDFNEFLLMLYEEGKLNTDFRPIPLTLGYHVPCQYRGHRLGRPGMEVLDLIPQLRTVDSHAACCGIAGTYGYKVEKYDIAQAVGEPLFDFIKEAGGPVVICDSETCRWQITGATGFPAVHPVELLAAAYGLPVEGALAKIQEIKSGG
jgi:glycerol-3-phosphate dehydrogenase subunit C